MITSRNKRFLKGGLYRLLITAAVKALALGAMLMSTPAQAADYYVAKTGDDGNAGTQGAPFATIGKAITEANSAIDGGADSFLSRGKARSVDAKLRRSTKWIAILFGVVILVLNVIAVYFHN